MKRISVIVISLLAVGYVTFCALLFFRQRSFIYFPTAAPILTHSPDQITIDINGETLRGWKHIGDSDDALIYFGGNAEDITSSFMTFSDALPSTNLFFVNYRGYGGSSGTPTEQSLFADACAIFDRIHEDHSKISVVGRSLGSGVAAYLASVRDVDKLILVTPYDSIENVAKEQFPIFPVSLLLKDKFDSAALVPQIRAKTLAILAENDQLIHRSRSEALIARFPKEQITVAVIPRSGHNSIDMTGDYMDAVRSFLADPKKVTGKNN